MGAIEFSISSFILNVFGAYCYILHPDYFISYWDLNDFHGRSDINALKHATQRKDFGPPSHQCWSWQPFSSFIFVPPPPSNINVGHPAQKPLQALPQNQHWWGRGRRNRPNFRIFDPFSLLSYSAHVFFDFTAPFANPPILGQRAWKSTALWNVSF